MDDVFPIYEALWRRAENKKASVSYYMDHPQPGCLPNLVADKHGRSGYFRPPPIKKVEDTRSKWTFSRPEEPEIPIVEDTPRPLIAIYRLAADIKCSIPSRSRGPEGAGMPPPDLHAELISLAHEYGHFRSWAGRTARSEYELYDEIVKRRDALKSKEISKLPEGLSKQERSDRLRAAARAALDDDARARIIREETLAWEIGREVLADLGLDDFVRYDQQEKRGLHNHRYRLGIDEAWPDDV